MEEPIDVKEALMLKLIEGEISQEEKALLDTLLKESGEDRSTYEHIEKLWAMTSPKEYNDKIDYRAGWASVRPKTIGNIAVDRPPLKRVKARTLRRLTGAAASISLIILVWLLNPFANSNQHIETAFGETKRVTFSDGSTATLNGGTRLSYPAQFGEDARIITLDGEAFFDVEAGAMPFIVQTVEAEVHVLGTQFNVRALEGNVSVAVREGRVRLQQQQEPDNGLTLEANEAGSLSASGELILNDSTAVNEGLDWIDGKLFFSKSTLNAVIEEFSRSMGVEIIVAPEVDNTVTISGTFDSSNPEVAIEALCLLAQCNGTYQNGIFYLNAP